MSAGAARMNRRSLIAMMLLAAMAPQRRGWAQTMKRLKIILNTSLSGPVSFFLLAEDRGYLREAGVEAVFSSGGGAAVVVPQVRSGGYDVGYGDISALIERIAREPQDQGPVAVYTTFSVTPFTIAVDAKGPIRTASDLIGRTLTGHPMDAALITFDLYADAAGIDAGKVKVIRAPSGMGSQVAEMLAGRTDGVFGFVNTIIASATPLGIAPQQLRFIDFSDHLPEMYGNTLFVTRELYRQEPGVVSGLVRALNKALADTAGDPKLAIDALAKRSPGLRREVDTTRLIGTLKIEMAHPEGARIGIGDMDDQRLQLLIDRIVRVKQLPRRPSLREIFDRSFLPPDGERIRTLAAR
jgi:NitT/TauT family transport system substrate-binding protein